MARCGYWKSPVTEIPAVFHAMQTEIDAILKWNIIWSLFCAGWRNEYWDQMVHLKSRLKSAKEGDNKQTPK